MYLIDLRVDQTIVTVFGHQINDKVKLRILMQIRPSVQTKLFSDFYAKSVTFIIRSLSAMASRVKWTDNIST